MFGRSSSNSHTWVEARLSAYVDEQLDARERAQIEKHLSACARCQAQLESLRWTIDLLKHAPAPALPRSFTLPVPARRASAFGFNFATMRSQLRFTRRMVSAATARASE